MACSCLKLRRRRLLIALFLAGALQQFGAAAMISAKAWLAPVLIELAWVETLELNGVPVKPWPWADTWPVARLRYPEQGLEFFVLAGDSGNALAFGPGHTTGSAQPGQPGTVVIGGHRDTHFAFLENVRYGDTLKLQARSGDWRSYTVLKLSIVDASKTTMDLSQENEELLLVTCYPFDALFAGGPLRYAVLAVAEEGAIPKVALTSKQRETFVL